ncbi:hypothetical protein ACIA6D_37830 [Streptomyces cacaoi]|uniref:hypothetical protein n=1 Tax=Streptomyces cacaoi TaxID=1898 RepID=UPI0037496DF7
MSWRNHLRSRRQALATAAGLVTRTAATYANPVIWQDFGEFAGHSVPVLDLGTKYDL